MTFNLLPIAPVFAYSPTRRAAIQSNHDCAAQEKHGDAVEIVNSIMQDGFSCRYYLPGPVENRMIIDVAQYSGSSGCRFSERRRD